jgi:hypothetical protein
MTINKIQSYINNPILFVMFAKKNNQLSKNMAALATLNSEFKTIIVSAKYFFYGTHATPELTEAIIKEINDMFNAPEATVAINGSDCLVIFRIEHQIVAIEELMTTARGNLNFRYNFVRIEEKNHQTRSFMGFSLGDNVGHWLTTDGLGVSTTAPHEFGHSLGLDHPIRSDFRNSGNPGIMAPRGTIVDAELQWDVKAAAGAYGGTLNPRHRKVQAYEIQEIFSNITFDENGYASLGHLSNVLFTELGEPVKIY